MPSRVNYNAIASTYNQRYDQHSLPGVARELRHLIERGHVRDVLEVGCGTGHWVIELRDLAHQVCGLDLSLGMLRQAQAQATHLPLVNGDANHLPFATESFDLVLSVNALHHYTDKRAFITEAQRLLRPGGALAIINMDPHIERDIWYLYDYFEGVRARDFQRFPSGGQLLDWLKAAGFTRAEWRVAERIHQEFVGRAVLDNPFTQKHGSSQLALLSDEAYAAGLQLIQAALAELGGDEKVFIADQWLTLIVGWLDERDDG